jgi:hypothetical protein
MDTETAVSYQAAVPGTPVFTRSGKEIGTLEHVLEVPSLDLFDGIVVATDWGLRFIDADQIELITLVCIRSTLDDEEAARLPPPDGAGWTRSATRCTSAWAGCSAARTGPGNKRLRRLGAHTLPCAHEHRIPPQRQPRAGQALA